MAYKISVNSTDLELQQAKLLRFRAFAEDRYKTAMRSVLTPTASMVKSAAPVFTGAGKKAIRSSVTGTGSNITGAVMNGDNTWYMNVDEYGRYKTKKMPPVAIIASRFNVPLSQAFAIARAIVASDANARKPMLFFSNAREKAFSLAIVAFAAANELIVQDMVK